MKQVPKKNYVIFILMLIVVVIITFLGVRVYNDNIKTASVLYKYLKIIKSDELDLYLNENPSTVIYISNRYDASKEQLEKKLKSKIIDLNLYENFIYLDKEELNVDFVNNFNKQNRTSITVDKMPILIIFNDNKVESVYYSLTEKDINELEFEGVR